MPKKVEAPIWIIFLSAISLVIGLSTYGYNGPSLSRPRMESVIRADSSPSRLPPLLVLPGQSVSRL